ncbi:MAG: hypothetical protein JWQ30_1387, partial [Sediminibacterium sp.]|nr:hypothetical protein [Sediminibacterium sp.]
IEEIKNASGKEILFLRNDMFPVLFKVKTPVKNLQKNSK